MKNNIQQSILTLQELDTQWFNIIRRNRLESGVTSEADDLEKQLRNMSRDTQRVIDWLVISLIISISANVLMILSII